MNFGLLESVPDAMVIVDPEDGRIVHMNGLAEELFGWSRAEAVGRPVEILMPERFRGTHETHRSSYAGAPRVRPMALGRELSGLRRTGEQFPAEIGLAPLRADGRLLVIAAVRDVTERKAIERQAQLYERARDEVHLRDEFLSMAAHEFKTPIAALELQAQMLLRTMNDSANAPLSSERLRVDAIHRQSMRLARLIQGLLDLTEMTAGRLVLQPEPVDLAAVVREAAKRWRDSLAHASCDLRTRAPGSIPGRWDRIRLEQVLDNLVANAMKFGAGKQVELVAEADGATAHILVRDEGIGIAPESQERIFERFGRAVPAAHFGGFGLGLWIVRQIVEAHGGEVRVSSTPGRGSTFEVTLPREADAA